MNRNSAELKKARLDLVSVLRNVESEVRQRKRIKMPSDAQMQRSLRMVLEEIAASGFTPRSISSVAALF